MKNALRGGDNPLLKPDILLAFISAVLYTFTVKESVVRDATIHAYTPFT